MTAESVAPPRPAHARAVLLSALAFALISGYVEAGTILFRRLALAQLAYASIDAVWMAPISYVAFALVPGILLAVLARALPRVVTWPRAVFTLALLAVLCIMYGFAGARLHVFALFILSAGVAYQVMRVAASRPQSFSRAMKTAAVTLGALTVLLAAALPGGRAFAERRSVAALPTAPPNSPNVLLVIWDTARRKNLSAYGYSRKTTPHVEEWAHRAVVFDRAIATASWTLPSHASMFTGRIMQELSTGWRTPLDEKYPTLAERLRERGYYTAGFVANVVAASRESGLNRGFIRYEDYRISVREILRSSVAGRVIWPYLRIKGDLGVRHLAKDAPVVTQNFIDWMPRAGQRPFFAFLNYYDAHDPYYAPAELRRSFRSGKGDIDRYDAALSYLDQHFDKLMRTLQQRGLLDNTIVILTSDHGELFGEKGLTRHGNSLYFPLLEVPLIIWPAQHAQSGQRIATAVSMQALPSTIMQLVAGSPDPTFPAAPLSSLWGTQVGPADPDTLVSGIAKGVRTPPEEPVTRGNMSSLVVGPAHYILNGDGTEELYDVDRDPSEELNLAGRVDFGPTLHRFRVSLLSRIPKYWTPVDPRPVAQSNGRVHAPAKLEGH